MIRLFGYEMQKLFSKRWLFLLLGILLAVCAVTFVQTDGTDERAQQYQTLYESELRTYSNLPIEDAVAQIADARTEMERMNEAFSAYITSENTGESLSDEDAAWFSKLKQQYGDDPSALFLRQEVYEQLSRDAQYLTEYHDWLSEMDTRAQQMLSISAFAKKETFSYRNIQKTPADYAHLKTIPLSFGSQTGILRVSDFPVADFAILIAILLFAFALFVQERENGTLLLVQSCRSGRAALGAAKLLAFLLCVLCTAAVLYGGTLLLGHFLYGYGDLSRTIQSVSAFKESNLSLHVGEYLWLFFAAKLLASMLCGVILVVLIAWIKNIMVGFAAAAAIIGTSYGAYWLIPSLSTWNLLKFVNPIAFLDGYRLFSQYNNLNVFGFPVTRTDLWLWLLLGFFAAGSILIVLAFSRSSAKASFKNPFEWIFERLRRMIPPSVGVRSILYHEHIKLYAIGKMAVVLLACVWIASQTVASMYVSELSPEGFYLAELQQVEGKITPKAEQYFDTRKQELDAAQKTVDDLTAAFERGELGVAEYQAKMVPFGTLPVEQNTFDRLYMQYSRAKELDASGIAGGIVNEFSAQWVFSHPTRDLMIGMFASLFIVVGTVLLFTREYKNNMLFLLRTTASGKSRLFLMKVLTACGFSAIVLLIFSVPFYISMANGYSFADMHISLQNIEQYMLSGISLNIDAALFIRQAGMLVGVLFLTAFCIWISTVIKRLSVCVVVSAAVGILPLALELSGISVIRYISSANAYTLFSSWNSTGGIFGSFAGLLLLLMLTVLFLFAAYRRFCATEGRIF